MRDYGYEQDVNARRALRGKGPVLHLEDVERAEWDDEDDAPAVVLPPYFFPTDDTARMSQTERDWHPENA